MPRWINAWIKQVCYSPTKRKPFVLFLLWFLWFGCFNGGLDECLNVSILGRLCRLIFHLGYGRRVVEKSHSANTGQLVDKFATNSNRVREKCDGVAVLCVEDHWWWCGVCTTELSAFGSVQILRSL